MQGTKRQRASIDLDDELKIFPTKKVERSDWCNAKTKRKVTEFQFRVYDLCAQIPEGYFSTYKILANKLASHPRAVGQALKVNPFAPLPVPCHRVIATDFFIGGYSGQWGSGGLIDQKRNRLAKEKVFVDDQGFVLPELRVSKLFKFNESKYSPTESDVDN